jgi:hypothetical protein
MAGNGLCVGAESVPVGWGSPVVGPPPGKRAARTRFIRMPNQNEHFLARSFAALQENVRRAGPSASAGYTLIGAIGVLGGVGHLIDRWVSTSSPWFLLAGMLLGVVVGFYELAKTVWKK